MKKIILLIFLALTVGSCSNNHASEIEALKAELKPGLGEIMGVIQQHHAKLYYSGMNENWALAAYQLDEIKEGLDQATELHEHFKDIKGSLKELRHITDQGVSSVDQAIKDKNKSHFLAAYKQLTLSCNQCHQATEHGFIVIQPPTSPMFTNQNFSLTK